MRRRFLTVILGAAIGATLPQQAAWAGEILITKAEAAYPNAVDMKVQTRSAAFGPGIEQILPTPGSSAVSPPVPLKFTFIARGAGIDTDSFRLFYLKNPLVDLTDRVKSHVSVSGLDMSDVEVPPGTHVLRLHLRDMQGRQSIKLVTITVAP